MNERKERSNKRREMFSSTVKNPPKLNSIRDLTLHSQLNLLNDDATLPDKIIETIQLVEAKHRNETLDEKVSKNESIQSTVKDYEREKV